MARARRGRLIDGRDDAEDVRLQPIEAHALPRRRHRRLDDACHGNAAQLAMDVEEPAHGPRGRDGAHADVELLLGGSEVGEHREELDLIRRALAPRGLDEEVVDPGLTGRPAGGEEAAAAQGGQHGLGDAGRAQTGQGGIEGVAAGIEQRGRRLGGDGVPGGDRALRGHAPSPSAHRASCSPDERWTRRAIPSTRRSAGATRVICRRARVTPV